MNSGSSRAKEPSGSMSKFARTVCRAPVRRGYCRPGASRRLDQLRAPLLTLRQRIERDLAEIDRELF